MFPRAAVISWVPEVGDVVTRYDVLVNGSLIASVPGTTTWQGYSIPGEGTYTARVIAFNEWGQGPLREAVIIAAPPKGPVTVTFLPS